QRQQEIACARDDGHRAEERPHGADADIGQYDSGHRRAAKPVEEEREHRQGDELRGREERERRDALREPDGAAVARREHEAVEHALLALRDERTAEPEQGGEEDGDPQQATRRELRRVRRQREVENDEGGDDEEQHGRQRVARAQLEQEILARERADVGRVRHASASCCVANGATRSGSCVETSTVCAPRNSISCASRSPAPAASSAVYGSSSTRSSGPCKSTRQIASRCVMPREYDTTRSWRTSQSPKRSRSMPIRSRRSGTW